MPPAVALGIALAAALLSARLVPTLTRRIRVAFAPLRELGATDAGVPYRSQAVDTPSRRTPLLLAGAAQALVWVAILSALRLSSLPFDLVNLLDEPHRDLGLVPDDLSLVAAHLVLGAAAMVTLAMSLLARGSIVRVIAAPSRRALSRLPSLRRAFLALVAAGASALAACLGLLARTPMSLYWLDWMAVQSALYAVACGLIAMLVGAAAGSAARWQRHTL